MKTTGWPWMSFSEVLRQSRSRLAGGSRRTANYVLYRRSRSHRYGVDMSLSGSNLDQRSKGSRVELVRAMDGLRGRVRILAQAGRVSLPCVPRAILGVLDQFFT